MPNLDDRIDELVGLTANATTGPVFDPKRICYPQQLLFVDTNTKRNVLRKTRRAGGTVALAVRFLKAAKKPPYANQLYVTGTLKNSRRLIWPTLKKLNAEYNLGGVPNETEAFLRFPQLPNEPVIYLGGAKDQDEIDKIRGIEGGLKYAAIDEAQSMRQRILKALVDDVIEPSLFDYDGTMDVIGTPGAVLAGYFYDIDDGADKDAWTHFFLSMVNNPFLAKKSGKSPHVLLAELKERRKWADDNPTYLREYLGQWVTDADALALHYDVVASPCEWQAKPEPDWKYIIGFDIGFEDADAIAVMGWSPRSRKLRLVKEVITRKQGITELGNQLRELVNAFRPENVVGDLGALGKKIGVELQDRWGIPVEAADKTRKAEHVALLDDALRVGTFLAPRDSRFAEDCMLVQWNAEAKAKGRLEFDDGYHSDICFVAGTLIQTAEGPVPVERICVGDLVLTRRGYRPITRACWTGTVPTVTACIGGHILTGTPDHPVWTENRGWVPLLLLADSDLYATVNEWDAVGLNAARRYSSNLDNSAEGTTTNSAWGDRLPSCSRGAHGDRQRPLRGMDASGVAGPGHQPNRIRGISSEAADIFIGRSGRESTASRSPMECTSTTSMRTGTTIHRPTLRRSPEGIMCPSTCFPGPADRFPLPLGLLQRSGTDRQRAESGIESTSRILSASDTRPFTASFAKSAPRSSTPRIRLERFAGVRVMPAGIAPVVGLSVAGEHEYFANGILVKNCDAVLYAFRAAYHWTELDKVPGPEAPYGYRDAIDTSRPTVSYNSLTPTGESYGGGPAFEPGTGGGSTGGGGYGGGWGQ